MTALRRDSGALAQLGRPVRTVRRVRFAVPSRSCLVSHAIDHPRRV
jgi:hypothetical protein